MPWRGLVLADYDPIPTFWHFLSPDWGMLRRSTVDAFRFFFKQYWYCSIVLCIPKTATYHQSRYVQIYSVHTRFKCVRLKFSHLLVHGEAVSNTEHPKRRGHVQVEHVIATLMAYLLHRSYRLQVRHGICPLARGPMPLASSFLLLLAPALELESFSLALPDKQHIIVTRYCTGIISFSKTFDSSSIMLVTGKELLCTAVKITAAHIT